MTLYPTRWLFTPAHVDGVIGLGTNLFFIAAYTQSFDLLIVWTAEHVSFRFGAVDVPPSWFVTIDGTLTIAGTALSVRLWNWQAKRGREPTTSPDCRSG